ncbi:MAG: hypothetical protein KC619_13825 [Myxococcales bacterium]|nr:hypothetical protein [Myxococcales bacterium]
MNDLRLCCVTLALAFGCAPPTTADPARAPALAIDGYPVVCGSSVSVGAEAELAVVVMDGEVRATLDEVPIALTLDDGRYVARLELDVGPVALRVRSAEGASCELTLVNRGDAREAEDRLADASGVAPILTRAPGSGAISTAVVEVPTSGDSPEERGRAFLDAYAEAFAVPATQLVLERIETASDGWETLRFSQRIDGVAVWSSDFTLTLDAANVVRMVHSAVIADLAAVPVHARTEAEVLGLPAVAEHAPTAVERVVHGRGAAGWHVTTEEADLLVDDAAGEIVERRDHVFDATAITVWVESGGHPSLTLRGDSDSPPTVWDRTLANDATRTLFDTFASIARYVAETHHQDGPPVDVIYDPTFTNAEAYGTGSIRVGDAYVHSADALCHEYAHRIHMARGGSLPRTIAEALADTFALGCGPAVRGGDDAFVIGEGATASPLRNVRAGTKRDAPWAITYYDEATADADPYSLSFLHTRAMAFAVERYAFPFSILRELAWESLAWNGVSDYPALRDRALATLRSWAQTGRFGTTSAHVCAMARAYRDTGLDGEYAAGAGCHESEAGDPSDNLCTRRICPFCDMTETALCPPESIAEGQPVCLSERGERICVGAVASARDSCARDEVRTCNCVREEGDAEAHWSCPETSRCRPRGGNGTYCPEG